MTATDALTDQPADRATRPPRTRRRLGLLVLAAGAIVALLALTWPRSRPDPEALFDQARDLARQGRYAEADATLGRLAPDLDASPVVRLLRAQVASPLGRDDEALEQLAGIPDADPLAPLARLAGGQIEARRGRVARAERDFLATLELNPRAVQARRELVYIYSVQQRLDAMDAQLAALADLDAIDLTHLLHWGLVLHTEWAAGTDLPALQRFVEADPDDRHSRLALAEALWRTGKPDEAAAVLEPLPADDPEANAARARLALDRGDLDRVDSLLADGPADHPGLAQFRGKLAMARGDAAEAARQFRIAHDARPDDRTATYNLALALRAAGKADEAAALDASLRRLERLTKLLNDAKTETDLPRSPLLTRLGLAFADAGRPREARGWLEFALARDPLDQAAQQALHGLASDRPDPAG